jgi:hypothetical protein
LPLLIDIVNPIYTKYDPGHVYEDAIADAGAGRCHVHASLLMRGWGFFGGAGGQARRQHPLLVKARLLAALSRKGMVRRSVSDRLA